MLPWVLAAAAALLVATRRMDVGNLADILREELPPELARWAAQLEYGARRAGPSDFPGGVHGFALFGASVLDEETRGGDPELTAGAYQVGPDGSLWNGVGDSGHGRTPWQIDDRSHAAYLARSDRTPETDSAYAMGLLTDGWEAFKHLDERQALLAAAASYNAGIGRVQRAIQRGADPDSVTTARRGKQVYAHEIVDRFSQWNAGGVA